ncbi:EpsG family protein [Sphingomonas aurantiaca]|uniref:EpsG family protein n=1 Tax=Sphingomonas aurantiaca TaxID=185949 RepID=UPI003364EC22
MTPYFVLLGIWLIGTIQFSSRVRNDYEDILYGLALVFTILMVGLRYQVGGDWATYETMYNDIALQPLIDALRFTDPAYALLNWISAKVDGGVYVANFACALVFALGLSSLARKQPNPWLAMTVSVPYLVIVVGMGYTRQAAAIGAICWAISTARHDRVWRIVAKVAFGALFHKTAILFLPILLAPVAKRNLLFGIMGSIAFVALATIALGGSSDRLVANYVNSDYQSSGAAIRIGMNVLAAAIFFAFRKNFMIPPPEKLIWTIISGLAVLSVFGLLFSSSSVGIDRLSLFLIPLQVFVYGNIPSLPKFSQKSRVTTTFLIISYSVAVQYVYFVHGSFSYTWLPYRTILLADTSGEV